MSGICRMRRLLVHLCPCVHSYSVERSVANSSSKTFFSSPNTSAEVSLLNTENVVQSVSAYDHGLKVPPPLRSPLDKQFTCCLGPGWLERRRSSIGSQLLVHQHNPSFGRDSRLGPAVRSVRRRPAPWALSVYSSLLGRIYERSKIVQKRWSG